MMKEDNVRERFEFIPENEEEEQWKTPTFITSLAEEQAEPEYLFYSNAIIYFGKTGMYLTLYPIKNQRRFLARAIIYAFRHKSRMSRFDLYNYVGAEIWRTKRAILKLWSLKPFEMNRPRFDEYKQVLDKWSVIHYPTFNQLMTEFSVYGIVLIKKTVSDKKMHHDISLTELGKKIVALHNDFHYIF